MMSGKRFWISWCIVMFLMVVAVGWGLSQWNLSNYKAAVADRLQLLNELRRGALEQYFATAEAELTFWGTSSDIVAAWRLRVRYISCILDAWRLRVR